MVTVLILNQAFELLSGSLGDLTDRGIPSSALSSIQSIISAEINSVSLASPSLSTAVPRDLRGISRGSHLFIDATVDVEESTSVRDLTRLEDAVKRSVAKSRKEVKEVRLQFVGVSH